MPSSSSPLRKSDRRSFVLMPHAMWHLTQTWRNFVTPYLWSYQRSNLFVENPLESIAKLLSTAFKGAALFATIAFRIGVKAGFSIIVLTFIPRTAFDVWPRSWAVRRSQENGRALTVL